MDSGSYIWKISRIMEISHVNVCLTLTATFRILRSVSVSMARNFWPVVASCQRITLYTYLCLPHSKHRCCVCCVDFWIKHWYCIELVNKRFPLYYIYCAEEMNLINVSADIHHSVSCGNALHVEFTIWLLKWYLFVQIDVKLVVANKFPYKRI